jgi:hypothetical protein
MFPVLGIFLESTTPKEKTMHIEREYCIKTYNKIQSLTSANWVDNNNKIDVNIMLNIFDHF